MVPTVPAGPPAGHRRMSSLRSTTLNFFKGNTKGSQLQHSSSLRRNELTISSPLPITEENVSPTTTGPPSRAVTDPMFSEKRHHFPSSAGFFEVGFGRGLIPASSKASSIGDEDDDDNESTITAGVESRQMSPSRQSEFERNVAGSATATQSARSKKRGAKLKMALSLLRRRSNTNLRRAYGDPVDEACETSRDRETFFEPLLDPDYVESSAASPAPTRRAATPTGFPVTPQKPNGFKFTLSPRSHHQGRQVLTKAQPPPPPPPLPDNRRHRRATVASVIFDPSGIDSDHPRNSVWSGRPTSSQSVILNGVPQSEEAPVGPEGAMVNGATGQGSGGGLFPRPSSLQRHWSDGARNAGLVSNIDRSQLTVPGSDQDRVRPLSFGPVLNGYGSMKITEAVTLETRVQELESQVAMLQGFITQHIEFPQARRTFSTGAPTTRGLGEDRDRDRDTLRPPPDDRMKRSFSLSSAGSSEKIESPEIPSTPRNLGPPPPRPVDQRLMVYNQHTEQKREETLQALEGFKINTESKRDTASTIKGPAMMMHDCDMGARSPSPTPIVSMAQYTGLVSQIQREQRSRRKLEAQIANLQEQMSLVLHRQLLQSSTSPTITDSMGLRTDFNSIRRKTSSEVPTPDLTPPRVSPIDMIPVNLFMGFDSANHGSDNDSIFMGVDADDNEVWETPAEERESIISDSDSERGFRETLSSFPSPQPRTMSLSQLTHKSSLATR